MPTYQSPGVYVEEVAAGARPLEGAGTAVAAFVGLAEDGPFNTPTLVSNWTQFTSTFGGFVAGSYLAQSVYGYFNERRRQLLRRPHRTERRERRPCAAQRPGQGAGGQPARAMIGRLKVVALDPAVAPGDVSVEVTDPGGDSPTEDMFRLVVKLARRGRRGVRPGQLRPGQAERRDHGQRRPPRPSSSRTPAAVPSSGWPPVRPPWSPRSRRPPCRRRGSVPTTTSATSPTAPVSPGWRRSKRSPCSACRT